jgi:hypothetical protein
MMSNAKPSGNGRIVENSYPIDFEEVRRALSLLADPDYSVELRFLPRGRSAVCRGNDLDDLTDAVRKFSAGQSVYYCINPVPVTQTKAAKDEHVVRRRWLLLDLDPVRAQGHQDESATDAEKQAVRRCADNIWEYLCMSGWPDPLWIDSGNGVHLLYRVDLPNDRASYDLVRGLLRALAARFDTAGAKVDVSVANAARIAKLPGTWSKKGTDTPERPHRLARLLQPPDSVRAVDLGTLTSTYEDLRPDSSAQQEAPAGSGQERQQPEGAAASEATAPEEKWPPLIALGAPPEVEPFPVEVFPDLLQRLVREGAAAMNTPADFWGVAILGFAGGALGRTREIAITPTHVLTACLYAGFVARPGKGKTHPFSRLAKPFFKRQAQLVKEFDEALEAWDAADPDERGPMPVCERCVVVNTTTESLKPLLEENPRGLVMIKNELSALTTAMNQYKGGKGDDRQFYCDLWDGVPLVNDRKSDKERRGRPLFVYDPFCGIVGAVQPDWLPGMRGQDARGRPHPDDGHFDRFLLAYPQELPAIAENWAEISPGALDGWRDVILNLLSLKKARDQDDGQDRPVRLPLSKGGKAAWEAFTKQHADECNAPDFSPCLQGPWAKLRTYCGRLALILHYLHWAVGQAPQRTIRGRDLHDAARLVAYFKSHARKIHHAIDADHRLADARRVLQWLLRRGQGDSVNTVNSVNHSGEFSLRDAHALVLGSRKTVEETERVLELLCKHNFIRPREASPKAGPGRKPSQVYEVNPAFGQEPDSGAGQNSLDRTKQTDNRSAAPAGDSQPPAEDSVHGSQNSHFSQNWSDEPEEGSGFPEVTPPRRIGTFGVMAT